MDLPDGWSTGTVRANGIDVHYYRAGTRDGPPLVMAHGYTDDGRCWEPLAADLADEYDLVMYDARGHGRSAAPETGYGIEDRVADLVGVVEALGLEEPILLGHSMGGSTVAWAAATHPDLARAAILEDPAGLIDGVHEGDPDEAAAEMAAQVREWHAAPFDEIVAEYDERDPHLATLLAAARTECSEHIAEVAREGFPRPRAAYERIDCPTLILKADAETAAQDRHREVADELRDGRLVHVPDAGHCVFRDEYDAAVAELRTFLDRLSARPR